MRGGARHSGERASSDEKRRRRLGWVLAGVVAVVIAGSAAAPIAVAETVGSPVPVGTGWRVTSQESGGGTTVVSIRRDSPLVRGQVAILPRSGLYRLRTVLASEQLVRGTGRDLVPNMCTRVHCHAAVNGDRFLLSGAEAGRISSALGIDGELLATQPRPPVDAPAAHALIGRDGSMAGTIAQLPFEPEMIAGDVVLPVDVNRQPTPERTTILNHRYSSETGSAAGTVEYVLSAVDGTPNDTALAPQFRREGSGPIGPDGVVLAAFGSEAIAAADIWWDSAVTANGARYRSGFDDFREVLGGSPLLLKDGGYGFPPTDSDGKNPRTIVGWNAADVFLVTVDGRQPGWSTGLGLADAARMMRWLGATDALNIDGGGSTAFYGFDELRNRPSDGRQRPVASALVIMPPENAVGYPGPTRPLDAACPSDAVPPNPFPDASGSVHTRSIACMAWRRIANGTADGEYEPLRPVRRDQMAAFLARYLFVGGATFPDSPPDAFPDDDDSIHEPLIDVLTAMGVIGGRADGTFGPAGEVSRGQMATFISRAVPLTTGVPLGAAADYFADDSGDVHEQNINRLTEAAIASGTVDGTYQAANPVRRDQMAAFLARALAATVEITAEAEPTP